MFNRVSNFNPAFNGKVVKPDAQNKGVLVSSIGDDAQKMKKFDTFCITLNDRVTNPDIASENAHIKMNFVPDPQEGLLCKLQYTLPRFVTKIKFPELVVKVFDPAFKEVESWLTDNKQTVNGKDDIIESINETVKSSRFLDWDHQGIVPMEIREDLSHYDNDALEAFSAALAEVDEALTKLQVLDPDLKNVKIMFSDKDNPVGQTFRERAEKATQTRRLTTIDVSSLLRQNTMLKSVIGDSKNLTFNQDSEGLKNMAEWLQGNIVAPTKVIVEKVDKVDKALSVFDS